MNPLIQFWVSLLLGTIVLPMPALAGRYVLNQSPQTIQRYFGPPISTVPASGSRGGETTYRYNLAGVKRVLPKLPKGTTFQNGFINNRKAIFNRSVIRNIPGNPRGRKMPKRGRKPIFDPAIFQERFQTIERVFAWEDKFKRLLLRFERSVSCMML